MKETAELSRGNSRRWWIIGASFLMVFTCLGFCSSTKGLYLAAITDALGLERSLFSFNDSARFLTTATLNLFFGALIARFGPRKLTAAGFAALIASMLVYSAAESVPVFCVGGILLGTGLAWTTTTMVGYMVDLWCREHKGTIMGAVLAANGLGGALASQVLSPLIYSKTDVFGYRTAYRITALILLVVGTAVVLAYRLPDPGMNAPKPGGKKMRGRGWDGIPFGEAVRKPYFLAAAVCVFLTGMSLQGINGVSSAHLRDVGFDPAFVASVLSIHSVALAACKFLAGLCYDRFGLSKTMLICGASALAMSLLLSFVSVSPSGRAMALAYSVISSMAMPLETIMLPLITGELFGRKSYAKLLGLFVAVSSFGYAAASPLSNLFFDRTGTYRGIVLALGGVMVLVSVTFQLVILAGMKERRLRERQPAEEEADDAGHV